MNTSTKTLQWLFGLCLPLVSSLTLAQAPAGDQIDRVKVSGQMHTDLVKFNVTETCQNIQEELQGALESQWERVQATGSVRVDFKLTGNEISEVRTTGGPRDYSRPIKRAVSRLGCNGRQPLTENYAFVIEFRDPDRAPADATKLAKSTGQPSMLAVVGH